MFKKHVNNSHKVFDLDVVDYNTRLRDHIVKTRSKYFLPRSKYYVFHLHYLEKYLNVDRTKLLEILIYSIRHTNVTYTKTKFGFGRNEKFDFLKLVEQREKNLIINFKLRKLVQVDINLVKLPENLIKLYERIYAPCEKSYTKLHRVPNFRTLKLDKL